MPASFGTLLATGLLLGWSVAWPPGPINAEIVRRGLALGFMPAAAVGLGACSGDALWALVAVAGAGAFFAGALMRWTLGILSFVLLVVLGALFARSAWLAFAAWRSGAPPDAAARRESARGGYLLGLGMALSSPWNIAFWLAVIGRPDSLGAGAAGAAVLVAAVLFGAAAWVAVLTAAVVGLRLTFASPLWDILTKSATAVSMLYFAARSLSQLANA